ncbi:MAG TPA: hypothetical protein VFK27_05965, partial [Bacillales bacterium]|nr:hypothetical protein [Bacillales bacterium]
WQSSAEAAEREWIKAERHYEQAEKAYSEVKQERSEREPGLFVKQEQLKQAKKIQKELKAKDIALGESRGELEKEEKRLREKHGEIEKVERIHEQWVAAQNGLKEKLKAIHVPYERRELIGEAAESARELNTARQSLSDLKKEQAEKEADLSDAERKYKDFRKTLGQLGEQIQRCYLHVSTKYIELRGSERRLEKAMAELVRKISDEETERERRREKQLAGILAQHLENGEPCPVCGSRHHPSAAEALVEESKSGVVEQLRSSLETGRGLSQDFSSMKFRYEQMAERLAERLDRKQLELSIEETASTAETENESLKGYRAVEEIDRVKEEFAHLRADLSDTDKKSTRLLADFRDSEKAEAELATL